MSLRSITVTLLALFSCFALAATDAMAQPDSGTGVEGEIWIGPVRGGPDRLGVPNSAPLANTAFVVKKDEQVVASFETDDQGRFRVALPPGTYKVSKPGVKGRVGGFGPFAVEVVAGQMKKVRWECDSGMH